MPAETQSNNSPWERGKALFSLAPSPFAHKLPRSFTRSPKKPLTQSNRPKNPPFPPSWDFSWHHCPSSRNSPTRSCSAPPKIIAEITSRSIAPLLCSQHPRQTPATNWRIKPDTTINMTTLLKYTYEYKLMIIWIKFTVCKQIY